MHTLGEYCGGRKARTLKTVCVLCECTLGKGSAPAEHDEHNCTICVECVEFLSSISMYIAELVGINKKTAKKFDYLQACRNEVKENEGRGGSALDFLQEKVVEETIYDSALKNHYTIISREKFDKGGRLLPGIYEGHAYESPDRHG